MTIGIYGIFSTIDNECLYVGQSRDIEVRWKQHITSLKNGHHKRKDFVEWFQNYDESCIKFSVLEECENNDEILNSCEIKWFHKLLPKFYGKLPSVYEKWNHSDITKQKIREGRYKILEEQGYRMKRDIICKNCQKIFHSKNKSPIFCSKTCRIDYDNKRFDVDIITEQYNSGLSLHKIAELYNCSYRTIHYFMVKHNIPRRK